MNSKLRTVMAGVTAVAVLAGGALAASSASAHPMDYPHHDHHYRHYDHGRYWGGGDAFGAGILGFATGAIVGSALSNSYNDDDSYCYRYKTYNPRTGMYMSYHGWRHCP